MLTCALAALAACAGGPVDTVPEDERSLVSDTPLADPYRSIADAIHARAMTDGKAYERLRHMCDVIGPRLSGSKGLENAVAWTLDLLREDGADVVRRQPVVVPHWVRGRESATLLSPHRAPLAMLGLGNSIATPPEGLSGDVLVLRDFDDLARRTDEVAGKIVLFNHPMPPYDAERGSGYGRVVTYRTNGASRAAEHGAIAVLVRSVTATSLDTPHTGMLRYDRHKPKIPAAAISVEDAQMLARLQSSGVTPRVHLHMEAHFLPDAPSANVIGELRGSELPDERVVIGGHLDSWDVGHGAHDDGGACLAALDVIRLLKAMNLRPRRTIRVVLFTNEENGLRGAREYVRGHATEMKDTVAAIEADMGVFAPIGFRNPKPENEQMERERERLLDLVSLLEPLGAARIRDGGAGADVGPMKAFGVPLLGLEVEGSRYFDYHHTHADTFDKVDPDDLHRCTAVLAIMAYVIADLPGRLGD